MRAILLLLALHTHALASIRGPGTAETLTFMSARAKFSIQPTAEHPPHSQQRAASILGGDASAAWLLRRAWITTAIAAAFHMQRSVLRPGIQRMTRRSCQLDVQRPSAEHRQQPSATHTASCCRAKKSVVLVDAPMRQRCAGHALAAEAATASSRRGEPIKQRVFAIKAY